MSSPIHGVRIYPDSVTVLAGDGAPILVHGAVDDDCTDFFYIFRDLAPLWRGHYFVKDFSICYDERGQLEDPMIKLRQLYGASLLAADVKTQLAILRGDDFLEWGAELRVYQGALLPIFREIPPFDLLGRLFWDRTSRLSAATWPPAMRAVLHMWDDLYWQCFSTVASDVDALARAHRGDAKLRMFHVDLDLEYPDPSNQELRPLRGDPDE